MNHPQSSSLADRVVLVTGSTTGLGLAIAKSFALAGARVALNYANDAARAAKAYDALQSTGARIGVIRADVTDAVAVSDMYHQIEKELGSIDIAVLNATPAQPQMPIESYTWSAYETMLAAFVKSPFLVAKQVLPHMKSQRWGRLINIGSEVLDEGPANFSAYVAAKGGQHGLTRSLATELAPWNITVNTVSPGWIPVERHRSVPQSALDAYVDTVPLKRLGTPEDVAQAVTFLASDAAGFVTGANIRVNGGRTRR